MDNNKIKNLEDVKKMVEIENLMERDKKQEAGQVNAIVMWRFTKIELPESGDYVWVCNKGDKQPKLKKWVEGDEIFYGYWIPGYIPTPPQAT